MSIGDVPITIELNRSPTTALIAKNGAGKSSIGDAVVFALFGKSFRGLNKNDMINTTNKRGTEVKLSLNKDGTPIVVVRGIKPDTFTVEVNGAMLPETSSKTFQTTLEVIIGFDFNSFIRTSVLGYANFIPFMGMSAAARREFVETALNLNIFTELNKVVKPQLSTVNAQFTELNKTLSVKNAVLKEKQEQNKKRLQDNQGNIDSMKEKIKVLIAEIEKINAAKQTLVDKIEALQPDVEKANEVEKNIKSETIALEQKIQKLNYDLNQNKQQVKFYENNSVCPTCKTEMDEVHTKSHLDELYKSENEITGSIAAMKLLLVALEEKKQSDVVPVLTKNMELNVLLQNIETKVREKQLETRGIKLAFADMTKMSIVEPLEEFETEIKSIEDQIEVLSIKQEELNIAIDLLKDGGIKANIIEQYLPFLNKTINEYIDVIGIGISVSFDDTFKETLRGRYADEFTYTSLSQGERARLNLAILFAWQDVIRIASGVESSLMIFDEVGSDALDSDGIDAFFNIIEMSCKDQNVFMISHNAYVQEKCRSQIRLQKINGFTKIV